MKKKIEKYGMNGWILVDKEKGKRKIGDPTEYRSN